MPNYPKTPKGWRSAIVQWHVPKRKRPIAYSTKATSDIITILMGDLTIKELRERITYDVEAKQVLDEYIKRGFGDWICKEHFQKWDMRHAYIPEDKRQIYENTKAKGEKYLDCPVLLCLPPNTTIEPDIYYEIDCSKVGSENDVGDKYVLVMIDLE